MKQKNKGQIVALGTSALILMLIVVFCFYNYVGALKTDNGQKNLATEIAYVAQGVLRTSSTALDKYNDDNYRQISDGRNKLTQYIDILSKGGVLSNGLSVPSPSEYLSGQIMSFQSVINDIITNINVIVGEKNDANTYRDNYQKYQANIVSISSSLSSLASGYNDLKVSGGNSSEYLSLIGDIYNKINSNDVQIFGDEKGIFDDDYLAEQNNALQIINQEMNDLGKISGIVKSFNMQANIKDNLLSNINQLYLVGQAAKMNANSIMDVLPKIVSAKKYADQTDKLSSRLDDAYGSLSFSLSTTHNSSTTWLIAFIVFVSLLLIDFIYAISVVSKGGDASENRKSEKKLREYTKRVNEYLNAFMNNGKLKKDIQIKTAGLSSSDNVINSLPLFKDLAHNINGERKDNISLFREIDFDLLSITEYMNSIIGYDSEFGKKIDTVLPYLDESRDILNAVYESSKSTNVEGIKSNIDNSGERITDTATSFNKLKESMQETNKSIKKVSETTQGMSDNLDEIRKLADKLQINALNTEVMTDVIMSKTEDLEVLDKMIKIKAYIKNVKELSTLMILQPLKKLEELNSSISKDTGESIRSLEQNVQDIVLGGESIGKVQTLISSIGKDLKSVSQNANFISDQTKEGLNKVDLSGKEFKDIKNANREAIDEKNKILSKLKVVKEKVEDKLDMEE